MLFALFSKPITAALRSLLLMDSLLVRRVDSSTVWFAGLVTEDSGSLEKAQLCVGNLPMDIMHGMFLFQPVKVSMVIVNLDFHIGALVQLSTSVLKY